MDFDAIAEQTDLAAPTLADAVRVVREAVPDLVVLYLFGSAPHGLRTATSDVDLAIWAERALDRTGLWSLRGDLEDVFRTDVDVVDLWTASTVMRAQVVKTAQVLYEASLQDRCRFEMHVFSMYAHFNLERRDLLDAIQRRGSVFNHDDNHDE